MAPRPLVPLECMRRVEEEISIYVNVIGRSPANLASPNKTSRGYGKGYEYVQTSGHLEHGRRGRMDTG